MRRRGSFLLETAMYLPVLFLLLFGTIEIAKVTYTYYTLQKTLMTVARYLGTQQGVNFCDEADAIIQQAKQFAVTGNSEGGNDSVVRNLSVEQIQVRIERVTDGTDEIGVCECSVTGCDAGNGGGKPDYIVVSIPEGYPFQLSIPQVATDPILLKPRIRVPFQGT